MTLLDHVKQLLIERKLCMLPSGKQRVDSDGKSSFKSPYPAWAQYNQPGAKLPSVEQLQAWNEQYHPSLWGFVTGPISGIDVFDADSPDSIALFHKAGLKPHVITRRGEHYYFAYPRRQSDHIIYTVSGVIPHVDIRALGGFINCLGSNPTASYKMLINPALENLYDLRQLPPEVIEGIARLQNKHQTAGSKIGPIGDTIPYGKRDEVIFSLACGLRHRGIPSPVIETALLDVNKLMCKPPLLESAVLEKVKSASKYSSIESINAGQLIEKVPEIILEIWK